MNQKSVLRSAIILGVIVLVGSFIAYPLLKKESRLRIFGPNDINPLLVDAEMLNKGGEHTIADFKLYNQDGKTIRLDHLKGKIYVADFFFTTCGNMCPKMTFQMERLNEEFSKDDDFILVSHTVTPEIDSIPVLKAYAIEHDAVAPKWHLLTGEKEDIYKLARQSYFAVKDQWKGDLGDFIHTENFVLVDKEGRIRGYYDGTDPEDVDKLIGEVAILKKEYELN